MEVVVTLHWKGVAPLLVSKTPDVVKTCRLTGQARAVRWETHRRKRWSQSSNRARRKVGDKTGHISRKPVAEKPGDTVTPAVSKQRQPSAPFQPETLRQKRRHYPGESR